MLTLHEECKKPDIKLITSVLKQFKVTKSPMAVLGPLVKVEKPEPSLAGLALYMKS